MFLNEFKEEFEVNGSYNAMNEEVDLTSVYDGVLESYINDYTIFEATLRRDFLEVNGLLTEAAEGNFLSNIWEKIVEAFKGLVKKIQDIIERFQAAIVTFKQTKLNQIVEKYKPYFDKENGELNDFSIKKYKLKKTSECEKEIEKLLSEYYTIANEFDKMEEYIEGYNEDQIKAQIEKIDGIKMEDIKEKFKKAIYVENERTNPFKEDSNLKTDLYDELTFGESGLYGYKAMKKVAKNDFKKSRDYANKKLKEIKKDKKMTDEQRKAQVSKCQTFLKFISSGQKYAIGFLSILIKELKHVIKEDTRLYVAAGKFLEGKMKASKKTEEKKEENKEATPKEESYITTDLDYINAVAEAEMYELGL